MSLRQSGAYKVVLLLGSVACVGGAGFLAYKTFFDKTGWEKGVQVAQASYAKGAEALDKAPAEAAVRFDEAALSAENAMKLMAGEVGRGLARDQFEKPNAEMNWVRARAIRDKAYAKAKADGTPLKENQDTTTNEAYRNYYLIPDAKELQDAFNSLRNAAASGVLNDNAEFLKDVTRVALQLQPIDWGFAEPILRSAVKLNPKDPRANYFLALYEFEQPPVGGGLPTAPEQRDRQRVAEAARYLAAAKANAAPYWRVTHMEAEMLAWEQADALRSKNKTTADARGRVLETLLFAKDGVLDRAARGVQFSPLSNYDSRGIFGTQLLAMKMATEATGTAADKVTRVKQVVQTAVATGGHMSEQKAADGFVEEAGLVTVQLLEAAQPILLAADPAGWKSLVASAEDTFRKHPRLTAQPSTSLAFAQLGLRDAQLDGGRKDELQKDAVATLEKGLAQAKANNAPALAQADFHLLLAETKLLASRPAAEVEEHVQALRAVDHPRVRGITNFLEGVLAERQGKLEKARKLLETVTTDPEMARTPFLLKAVSRLAPITLNTGDPGAAAGYYAQVADSFTKMESLNPAAKSWLELTASGRDEVTAFQVVATVQAGLQRIDKFTRENPNQPVPADQIKQTVEASVRLARGLRAPSAADRTSRLAIAGFLLATKQMDAGDQLLQGLSTDYPDSVEVLRTQVARLVTPPAGAKEADAGAVAKADEAINKFLLANPTSTQGKLLKAQWLIRMKRPKDAADFLKDPKNFPTPDAVVSRLLAGALFDSGNKEEGRKILSTLQSDPAIDLVLIQGAASKEEAAKGLETALKKYENNGLIRVYDAAKRLTEGKYEEAAREFRSATEFTQVKRVANAGLARSLVLFAGSDPAKASPLIQEYIADKADEPSLYPAAALALLYLDQVGSPSDQWEQKRTMYAAVNRWEQLAVKAGTPAEDVGFTKSQYHLFAGNPPLALQEAVRTTGKHPNHLPTLMMLAELYLSGPFQNLPKAKEFIDRAQSEAKSENPAPFYLEGAWREATKDYDGAAKLYERMVTQFADQPGPYARRVAVAVAQNKTAEAVSWANRWVAQAPDDASAHLTLIQQLAATGDSLDEAVKKADAFVARQADAAKARAAAATPPVPPDQLTKLLNLTTAQAQLQVATALYRAKQLPEAKKRVDLVLKDIPDSPAALLMAGDIAMAENDWGRAEQVYRKRLADEKKDFVAANNLAWILVEKKADAKEAIDLVTKIRAGFGPKPIAAERLPAEFLDTIAVVYLKLNDPAQFAEMRETFEGAVKRYPTDPRMHLYLGRACAALGQRSQALVSLDTAIRLAADPAEKTLPDPQKAEVKKAAEDAKSKIAQ